MSRRLPLLLTTALALAFPKTVWAQDDDDEEDYTEAYVQTTDSLARDELDYRLKPLGFGLMGDSIDEFTGALSFSVTDVSIPGNSNLEVAFRRAARDRQTTARSADLSDRQQISLSDWEIDVPYISSHLGEYTTTTQTISAGWQWDSSARCDLLEEAREGYEAAIFNGVNLNIPGRGAGKVLEPSRKLDPNTGAVLSPWEVAPQTVQGVTKDYTIVSCIAEIGAANGGGQGFVATTTDGTQYRMDKIIRSPLYHQDIKGAFSSGPARFEREEIRLAATQATDVHGNWVKYDYTADGKLTKIHSNDGRQIDIAYVAGTKNVSSVTANGRTWTYSYQSGLLHTVTQPDGRQWTYDLGLWADRDPSICTSPLSASPGTSCLNSATTAGPISVTHPYGMAATFDVKKVVHAYEEMRDPTASGHQMILRPETNLAVEKKTLSGPQVPTSIWQYSYENLGNISDLLPSAFANATRKVSRTDPDGRVSETSFFIGGYRRGKAATKKRFESSGGALLSETEYTYTTLGIGDELGELDTFNGSLYQDSTTGVVYVSQAVTKRGSDTFTIDRTYDQSLTSPDYSYGLPLQVSEYSNASPTIRTQTIVYAHNKTKWVLGLPDTVTRNGKLFDDLGYDANGQVLTHDQFGVRRGTYTYHSSGNAAGRLATSKDGLDRTITYNSWIRGTATDVTRPDNKHLLRTVDANGWITSQTDAKGNTTSYQYSNVGWMTAIDRPSPWADINISYSGVGGTNFYQKAIEGSIESVVWYDGLHRSWRKRTRPLNGGGLTTYTKTAYDSAGRKIFSSFPSSSLNPTTGVETTYDGLNRVLTNRENVAPFATTTYAYLTGNKTRVTDPEGNQTTTTLRAYGRPNRGEIVQIAEPLGKFTDMTYDAYGNILTATQYGNQNGYNVTNTQSFVYDGRLRLCRHSQLESGDTLYQYDNANQVIGLAEGISTGTSCASLPAGAKIASTYDNLGRVTLVNYPGTTPDLTVTYDDNGNVTRKQRGTTDWNYLYDNADQLTEEKLLIDGRTYTTEYEYNTIGALTYQTFPTGMRVEFAPNGLGQAKRARKVGATIYANGFTYHRNGAVNNINYGNGFVHTAGYNARQLLDSLLVEKAGTKAVDLDYAYDSNARITSITDGAPSQTALSTPLSGSFTYDALDNIREKQLGSRVVEMQYNTARRLNRTRDTADGNVWRNYSYDTRGSVTGNGKLTFVYDTANQPTSLSGTGVSGSFVYDGNLKRAKQTMGGDTIYSVYGMSGALIHRDNASSNVETDYVRAAGKTIARIENGTPTYTHNDHLGSPVSATTSTGAIAWQEDYTPYGEKRIDPLGNRNDQGFTGHIDDAATGLTYMQARYYDPNIGRFLSKDPIDFLGGGVQHFNRYAYVGNEPVNFVDATGKQARRVMPMPGSVPVLGYPTPLDQDGNGWTDATEDGAGALQEGFDNASQNLRDFIDWVFNNDSHNGSDVIIPGKIQDQVGDRGWSEEGIRDTVDRGRTGVSTDGTGGRGGDPAAASVYGERGRYVIVNDETDEVIAISDKNDSEWMDDSRIDWDEDDTP